jgi:predicted DNA-binding transcriptional regulator YafY
MARGEPLVRQWNLLKALQAHRAGVATDDLAARLGCSRRQVQRDLGVLKSVGFPIERQERDFGKRFWRLAPQFVESEGLVLSLTETVSLYLARQMLAPLAGTPFGDGLVSAFDKIKAILPHEALLHFGDLDETLLVKSMARPDYTGREKEIAILNRAILDGRVVRVRYLSAGKGREWDARFRPYGLVYFGTDLYAIGHIEEYGEVRTLKLARIRGVQMTGEAFERPADFSLAAYLDGSFGIFSPGRLQTVEVRFTGWAATSVREHEWHPSQAVVQDAGGALTVRFRLSDTRELKRWLLGYGRHAVVVRPASLRADLREEICAACAGYGAPASAPCGLPRGVVRSAAAVRGRS